LKWTKGSALRDKEKEAISAIHAYRRDVTTGLIPGPPNTPAQIMRSLIDANHGHADMRFQPIAAELGVTMKTLQRTFRAVYGMSMCEYQLQVRMAFARYLLSLHPRPKLSVIANQLGYRDAREFARMFRAHTDTIPSRWRPEKRD
jgi:AraC-like DNA-binding protein